MSKKLLLGLLIIILGITTVGCQKAGVEKPEVGQEEDLSDHSDEGEPAEEEAIEETEEQVPEVEEPKIYIGEAFDTIVSDGKIGFVDIYKEKSSDSEIIETLENNEKVELLETLPYGWFKVKLEDGREGYGDTRYIRTREIPPHDYTKDAEGYVLIYTHEDQTLKIYKDGDLVEESKSSSGLWDHFTPRGIFEIEKGRRGKWFYVERFEQGMKYWVGFKGVFLFHSLVFDKDQNIIQEEADKLGQPASHGCIRLPVETAQYIYENVPEGSLVLID